MATHSYSISAAGERKQEGRAPTRRDPASAAPALPTMRSISISDRARSAAPIAQVGSKRGSGDLSSHCAGAIAWDYDRTELIADGLVHVIGVSFGSIAAVILLALAITSAGALDALAVAIYSIAFISALLLSAIYNVWPVSPAKWLLRRLDHSAIYVLIAGTYTPFIVEMRNATLATVLLVAFWSIAALGIAVKLTLPGRFDRLSIAVYLLMGWSGMMLYHVLFAGLPTLTIRLVIAGGLLYTAGVPFHLWQRLRFQNAIWHAFVLLGTACQFAAVTNLLLT
ncbi:MAG: PAQR family membrane homeostasis protein TrhA [Bradyrhizobium sp.]